MSADVRLIPLHAFMVRTGTSLTFCQEGRQDQTMNSSINCKLYFPPNTFTVIKMEVHQFIKTVCS